LACDLGTSTQERVSLGCGLAYEERRTRSSICPDRGGSGSPWSIKMMLRLGGCGTRRHVIGFRLGLRDFDCSCFVKPHVEVLSSLQGINIKNRTINTYPAYFRTRRRLLF
jgi:hypothetical protein